MKVHLIEGGGPSTETAGRSDIGETGVGSGGYDRNKPDATRYWGTNGKWNPVGKEVGNPPDIPLESGKMWVLMSNGMGSYGWEQIDSDFEEQQKRHSEKIEKTLTQRRSETADWKYKGLTVSGSLKGTDEFDKKFLDAASNAYKKFGIKTNGNTGYCAVVSKSILDELGNPKNLKLYHGFVAEDEHVFLYDKSTDTVWDATASQFDSGPDIQIKNRSDFKYFERLTKQDIRAIDEEIMSDLEKE